MNATESNFEILCFNDSFGYKRTQEEATLMTFQSKRQRPSLLGSTSSSESSFSFSYLDSDSFLAPKKRTSLRHNDHDCFFFEGTRNENHLAENLDTKKETETDVLKKDSFSTDGSNESTSKDTNIYPEFEEMDNLLADCLKEKNKLSALLKNFQMREMNCKNIQTNPKEYKIESGYRRERIIKFKAESKFKIQDNGSLNKTEIGIGIHADIERIGIHADIESDIKLEKECLGKAVLECVPSEIRDPIEAEMKIDLQIKTKTEIKADIVSKIKTVAGTQPNINSKIETDFEIEKGNGNEDESKENPIVFQKNNARIENQVQVMDDNSSNFSFHTNTNRSITGGSSYNQNEYGNETESYHISSDLHDALATVTYHYRKKKPFLCRFDDCNKSFSFYCLLDKHIRKHTNERRYGCTFENCDKSYTRRHNLKLHLRTHTNERPYGCTFENCDKSFTTSGRLKLHTRTHTNERPYSCVYENCDKSYTRRHNLKLHLRTHTNERPYG
eukprot:Awhi_evm1s3145